MWPFSAPHVLLDKHKRIIGALAGTPRSPDWDPCIERVGELFDKEQKTSKTCLQDDRRGDFAVVNFGFSYGGGQTVSLVSNLTEWCSTVMQCPMNIDLKTGDRRHIVQKLLRSQELKRLARHQSGQSVHHSIPINAEAASCRMPCIVLSAFICSCQRNSRALACTTARSEHQFPGLQRLSRCCR